MKVWLKTVLCAGTMLAAACVCGASFAQTQTYTSGPQNGQGGLSSQNWTNSQQNWQNNPNNWQNSSQNWNNSSQDWKNSPQNWQNSGNNYNNANGIYDSNGNRAGYAVPTGNGGINYYNNNGNRSGYQPGQSGQSGQ
jgi:hypothetical protein